MGVPGDAELLRAARRDPEAFCRFYERHAARLRAWLRHECGSLETATDLTAETFSQALISLGRFRGTEDAQAAAWLYGIARNLLAQYRRRQRVETAARRRLDLPVRDYGGYDESDEQIDAETLARELHLALAGLPDGERAALTLRVVEQLPYDEIARRLALAPPAARMRVARALQTLRTRLSGAA
jgi:RNA polymerase sigma factor (sigma-70 family)